MTTKNVLLFLAGLFLAMFGASSLLDSLIKDKAFAGPVTLTVQFVGDGAGEVLFGNDPGICTETCRKEFPKGRSEINVFPVADDDSFFAGWAGDCVPGNINCVVKTQKAGRALVVAYFKKLAK